MPDLVEFGRTLSVWFLPVIVAITFHEAAHGWMAEKLGDDTARRLGRVTFNPIAHVDPFGTLVLPGLLLVFGAPFIFGWAKPVPVAFHRLRHPKRDMIWVALAGPGINMLLAVAAALLMHLTSGLPPPYAAWVGENLANAVIVNVVLAAFNMLPIPPLDGGRVLTGILPLPLATRFARIERYGLLLLILVLFVLPMAAREFGYAFNPLAWVLLPVVGTLYDIVLAVSGWNIG